MITWSGYNWLTQERWGEIHPGKSFCWYDPNAVEIDESKYLHLKTQYNPKYFPELDITSSIGIGLVSCIEKFYHGTYEIEAKLPSGPNLWPAFWLYSFDTWPPEIDVFEGYTNSKGSYFSPSFSPLSLWDVQSNIHYDTTPNNKNTGAKQGWFSWRNPSTSFFKYRLEWQPSFIKIYYNNCLVRSITDSYILDQFNKTTLNVIINNSVSFEVDIKNPPKSDFIVKFFKFTPYLLSTN
jgi:hypothetical protein